MAYNEITLLWFVLNFSAPSQDKINCNSWRGISVKQFSFLLSANNKNISNIWLKKKERNNLGFIFFCLLWAVLCYKQRREDRCQFHQHFLRVFFVWTSFWQLFTSYVWFGVRILYKKMREKRWWNWQRVCAYVCVW